MINQLFQWLAIISLAFGAPIARTQTVFDLETTSGEQSFCKDIPLHTDGNSGWITNPQLEYGFRYLLKNAGSLSLGSISMNSVVLKENPGYGVVLSVENHSMIIHIDYGFLFFESNQVKQISGAEAARLMVSLDALEQTLKSAQAKAIVVEEWVMNLHWDVTHPFWHGTGTRKIMVWVAQLSGPNSLNLELPGQGAQCEAPDIEVELHQIAVLT